MAKLTPYQKRMQTDKNIITSNLTPYQRRQLEKKQEEEALTTLNPAREFETIKNQPIMTGSSAINNMQKASENPLFRVNLAQKALNIGTINPAPYVGKANVADTIRSIGSMASKTIGEIPAILKKGAADIGKTEAVKLPATLGSAAVNIAKSGAGILSFTSAITPYHKEIKNMVAGHIREMDKLQSKLREYAYNDKTPIKNFVGQGVELAATMAPAIIQALYTGDTSGIANVTTNLIKFANPSKSILPLIKQGSMELFKSEMQKMATFGVQAFGSAFVEAEQENRNFVESTAYATASAFNEMITEIIPMGTIEKMFGIGDDLIKKYTKKGLKNAFKYYGGKALTMASSALQNVIQEIAVNPMTAAAQKAIYKPDMKWTGSGGVFDKEQVLPSAEGALGMSLIFAAFSLPFGSMARNRAQAALESETPLTKSELTTLANEIKYDTQEEAKAEQPKVEEPSITRPQPEQKQETGKTVDIIANVGDEFTIRFNENAKRKNIKIVSADSKKGRYEYEFTDGTGKGTVYQNGLNKLVQNATAETKVEREARIKKEKQEKAKAEREATILANKTKREEAAAVKKAQTERRTVREQPTNRKFSGRTAQQPVQTTNPLFSKMKQYTRSTTSTRGIGSTTSAGSAAAPFGNVKVNIQQPTVANAPIPAKSANVPVPAKAVEAKKKTSKKSETQAVKKTTVADYKIGDKITVKFDKTPEEYKVLDTDKKKNTVHLVDGGKHRIVPIEVLDKIKLVSEAKPKTVEKPVTASKQPTVSVTVSKAKQEPPKTVGETIVENKVAEITEKPKEESVKTVQKKPSLNVKTYALPLYEEVADYVNPKTGEKHTVKRRLGISDYVAGNIITVKKNGKKTRSMIDYISTITGEVYLRGADGKTKIVDFKNIKDNIVKREIALEQKQYDEEAEEKKAKTVKPVVVDKYVEADENAEIEDIKEAEEVIEGTVRTKISMPNYEVGSYVTLRRGKEDIAYEVRRVGKEYVLLSSGKKQGTETVIETIKVSRRELDAQFEGGFESPADAKIDYKNYTPKYLYKKGNKVNFVLKGDAVIRGVVEKGPLENDNIVTLYIPATKERMNVLVSKLEEGIRESKLPLNKKGISLYGIAEQNKSKQVEGIKEEQKPEKKYVSNYIYNKGDVITLVPRGANRIVYGIIDSVSRDGTVKYTEVKSGKELSIFKNEGENSFSYKVIEAPKGQAKTISIADLDFARERAIKVRSIIGLPLINSSKVRSGMTDRLAEIREENKKKIEEWERKSKENKDLARNGVKLQAVSISTEQQINENLLAAASTQSKEDMADSLFMAVKTRSENEKIDFQDAMMAMSKETGHAFDEIFVSPEFMLPVIKYYAVKDKTSYEHIMTKLDNATGGAYSSVFKSADFLKKLYEGRQLTKRIQSQIDRASEQFDIDSKKAKEYGMSYEEYVSNKDRKPIYAYSKGKAIRVVFDEKSGFQKVVVQNDFNPKGKSREVEVMFEDGKKKKMLYFMLDRAINNADIKIRNIGYVNIRKDGEVKKFRVGNNFKQLEYTEYFNDMLQEEENRGVFDPFAPSYEKSEGTETAEYASTQSLSIYSDDAVLDKAIKAHYLVYGDNASQEAQKAAKDVLSDVILVENELTKDSGIKYRVVGKSFSEELLETGKIDITNKRVSNAKELGVLAQIFRDPHMETSRVVFVKGDQIVGMSAITARMPSSAAIAVGNEYAALMNFKKNTKLVMQNTGADGFYMVHNHPFANTHSNHLQPSRGDFTTSVNVKDAFKDSYKGDVIINSGEYITIVPEDLAEDFASNKYYKLHKLEVDKDMLYKPSKENYLLNKTMHYNSIDNTEKLAYIAKHIESYNDVPSLIFTNDARIVGVAEIDGDFLDANTTQMKDYLREAALAFGGDNVYVVLNNNTVKLHADGFNNLQYLLASDYVADVQVIGKDASVYDNYTGKSADRKTEGKLSEDNEAEYAGVQLPDNVKEILKKNVSVITKGRMAFNKQMDIGYHKQNAAAEATSKYRFEEIKRKNMFAEAFSDVNTQEMLKEFEVEYQYEQMIAKNKESIKSIKQAMIENKETGEFTADDMRNMRDTIKQLYGANEQTQKAIDKIVRERAKQIEINISKYAFAAKIITATSDNWKDKNTSVGNIVDKIGGSVRILREMINRTIYDMAGSAVGKNFERMYTSKIQNNSAAAEDNLDRQLKAVDEFFKMKQEEAYATVAYIEGTKTAAELEGKGFDIEKIRRVAETISKELEDVHFASKVVLARNGFKLPGYLRNYFPHKNSINDLGSQLYDSKFRAMKETLGSVFNIKIDTTPTDLTGLMSEFHPKKISNRFFKQRLTDDAFAGNPKQVLRDYFVGTNRVIYHTEDILALRALENQLRTKSSPQGVARRIAIVDAIEDMPDEMKEYTKNKIAGTKGKFLDFINALTDYTGVLAGKEDPADSELRRKIGNASYQLINKLLSNTAINAIALNIKMVPTNLAQLPQVIASMPTDVVAEAMKDTIRAVVEKDDSLKLYSNFYKTRASAYRKSLDGVQNAVNSMSAAAFASDLFVSELAVRSAYINYLRQGNSAQEAMRKADLYASKLMGDRSFGMMPPLFYMKNPAARLFTMFQLEANNQYSFMFKDMPELAKEYGENKYKDNVKKQQSASRLKLLGMVSKILIGFFLFNEPYEKLTGRRLLPDMLDITKDFVVDVRRNPKQALTNATREALQYTPLVGNLFGGGKLPIDSSILDLSGIFNRLGTSINSNDWQDFGTFLLSDMIWKAPSALFPYGGMGQLRKTAQGIDSIVKGGTFTSTGKMMYPSEKGIDDKVRAILFGKYASETARNYYRTGSVPLSESQTKAVLNATDPNKKYANIIFTRMKDRIVQEKKEVLKKDYSYEEEQKRLQKLEKRLELITRDYKAEYGY